MTNENPFAKATTKVAEQKVETSAVKAAEPTSTGRRVISEETIEDSNWINLPKKNEIGNSTPEIKISPNGYYNQEGKEYTNKKTGKPFYSGLTNGEGEKAGEFIIEGTVDGITSKIRLANWELVYKMSALVKFCKSNNFTLTNQKVSFKRINEGTDTAGDNWELLCSTLKIVISGKDSHIKQF